MTTRRTLTHWGGYDITSVDGRVQTVVGRPEDPDPAPMTGPIRRSGRNRVRSPAVRSSWLRDGVFANPEQRGVDPLVDVDWGTALDLAASALDLVRQQRGNAAIYGGSYGWGSAGRFHHPQSQLKRFLNTIGGFTGSVGTYSHAAAEVVVPAVAGLSFADFQRRSAPTPDVVATKTRTFVSFGGYPADNTRVTSGGDLVHWYRPTLRKAARRGASFISISPTIGDFDRELGAKWLPIRPGTDAAVLMAITTHIARSKVVGDDERFGSRYLPYLFGDTDGVAKDAEWAAEVCGLDVNDIVALSETVAAGQPTLLNATWSTQRVEHGEQATWALLALGAFLRPSREDGSGATLGYGSMGSVGAPWVSDRPASVPQGENPVGNHIPVARIADALRNPGATYRYGGAEYRYPEIDAIYWCGGNPFHHHQDLHGLDEMWKRPRAVIVNEPAWTATARRSDIVFPSTFGFERSDLGGASTARHFVLMEAAVEAPEQARNDHDIFGELAKRLGTEAAFTEGRTAEAWIEELYNRSRDRISGLPSFADLRRQGVVERPATATEPVPLASVEFDRDAVPIGATPHPMWIEPEEWLGSAKPSEFHLVSPMPPGHLHSQHGGERPGPPVVRANPQDLERVGLAHGDLVRVWNNRGSLVARAEIDFGTASGVLSIENGYPFRPDPNLKRECAGGNANCLTADRATSEWAQGTTAHSCLVSVEPVSSDSQERSSGGLVGDETVDDLAS